MGIAIQVATLVNLAIQGAANVLIILAALVYLADRRERGRQAAELAAMQRHARQVVAEHQASGLSVSAGQYQAPKPH